MKKILLLGLMSSFLFFSCNGFLNPDSKQDSPAEEKPIQQEEQETKIRILNNSSFPIDIYEYVDHLVYKNIAPNTSCDIPITDNRTEVVYYVHYHIQIEGIEITTYEEKIFTVPLSIENGNTVTGTVQNPARINLQDSWFIIENKSSYGILLYNGASELSPEKMQGKILNTKKSGVYKINALNFETYAIKKAYNSEVISFPFTEIVPGKVYKLVVDDSKCYLESKYSLNCAINYETEFGIKPTDITLIIDETFTEKQLPILSTDKNYIFDGWYIGDIKVSEGYRIKDDITLTAKWVKTYIVQYETTIGTKPDNSIIGEGENLSQEQLPELKDKDFIFDGWYIGETKIIAEDYIVTTDITLTAGWKKYLDNTQHCFYRTTTESLYFDFADWQESGDLGNHFKYSGYSDGVLTIYPIENGKPIKSIIFTGAYLSRSNTDNHSITSTISGLSIKLANIWTSPATIIFENIAFESSKNQPLIESPVDLLIEYKGNNKLSSSANDAISLIQGSKDLIFMGDDCNSNLTLKPNIVTKSKVYDGSIAVKATGSVTIHGGTFIIEGSNGNNGKDQDKEEKNRRGGNGSSGIDATKIIFTKDASINITAGDGGKGGTGPTGTTGTIGTPKEWADQTAGTGDIGGTGVTGGIGGNGGDAIIGNLKIESSAKEVVLSGGAGGQGGTGGTGGTGGQGGTNYIWKIAGGRTGDGGEGGIGGTGGKGGDGGNAVSGLVENLLGINVHLNPGNYGKGGDGGKPGAGGSPGVHDAGGSGDIGIWGKPGKEFGDSGSPGINGIEHF